MLLLMIVGLYTSRLVLNSLGVIDYGIYTVVGGFVAMFSLISDSLTKTISRYITFNIGLDRSSKLNGIFCSAVIVQLSMSLVFFIVSETFGLWFLDNKLIIPPDRLYAAHWIFQLSIVSFILNLVSVPYNAIIVAHERMDVFSYISSYEALSKLFIAFLLSIENVDKLILYSTLNCLVALSVRFIYGYYCQNHFEEAKFKFMFDKREFREMVSFSSWCFVSSSAVVLRVQGTNVMLNLFFGPVINTAKGIANQITSVLHSFVANFMVALSPQITKSYAMGELEYEKKLMFVGSKFSFFLFLFFSLPIFWETHFILKFWLGNVPEHSVLFIRLLLFYTQMNTLSNTMSTAIMATGRIKKYELTIGCIEYLNLPISYVLLKVGAIPEVVTVVCIFTSVLSLSASLFFLRRQIKFPIKEYLTQIYFKSWGVCLLGSLIPLILISTLEESWMRFFIIISSTCIISCIVVLFVGCNKRERSYIYLYRYKIKKIYKCLES